MTPARDALEERASEFVTAANDEDPGMVRDAFLDTAAMLLTAARKVGTR